MILGYGFLMNTYRKLRPQGHVEKIEKAPCFVSDLYHLVNTLDFLMFSKKGIKV